MQDLAVDVRTILKQILKEQNVWAQDLVHLFAAVKTVTLRFNKIQGIS